MKRNLFLKIAVCATFVLIVAFSALQFFSSGFRQVEYKFRDIIEITFALAAYMVIVHQYLQGRQNHFVNVCIFGIGAMLIIQVCDSIYCSHIYFSMNYEAANKYLDENRHPNCLYILIAEVAHIAILATAWKMWTQRKYLK